MELADKSLGDLLRRLPIIILEDSTLHPRFPLLVWLMMASSKDYPIPLKLMKLVFETVYEMASCPWRDCTSFTEAGEEEEQSTPLSIAGFQETLERNSHRQLDSTEVLVWSILMRRNYGGMAGDIQMLQEYARVWSDRFSTKTIPVSVAKRFNNASSKAEAPIDWECIPSTIHQSSSKQSPSRITALLPTATQVNGWMKFNVPSLTLSDITCEGVDFHCSSVLESAVFSDKDFVHKCMEALPTIALPSDLRFPGNSADVDVKRAWFERFLKRCMWNFSAGVNHRLPLYSDASGSDKSETGKELKAFWQTWCLPRTKAFSERYVKDRLS